MERRVVYTVLTGGYDSLAQPRVTDARYDYVCFTDVVSEAAAGVWQLRPIPPVSTDMLCLSRYPKMHPHELLAEYEWSIYVDANVVILTHGFYDAVERCIREGVALAGLKHPFMDCAYEECLHVLLAGKERDVRAACREHEFLRHAAMPRHWGMYEANVILRHHADKRVRAQGEEWWHLFMGFAHRDQLAYSYTLYHAQLPFAYILPKADDRRYGHIEVRRHPEAPVTHKGLRHYVRVAALRILNALPFTWVYAVFNHVVAPLMSRDDR
ncbi:MAG: hypothetical protein IJS59_06975 [Bacteroidaceae bacterium]|nr:hypothetical protein [Bacteroidaceae bacterium]